MPLLRSRFTVRDRRSHRKFFYVGAAMLEQVLDVQTTSNCPETGSVAAEVAIGLLSIVVLVLSTVDLGVFVHQLNYLTQATERVTRAVAIEMAQPRAGTTCADLEAQLETSVIAHLGVIAPSLEITGSPRVAIMLNPSSAAYSVVKVDLESRNTCGFCSIFKNGGNLQATSQMVIERPDFSCT